MKQINKSEIKVYTTDRVCAVVGPSKVCKELADEFGAKPRVFRTMRAWVAPVSQAKDICAWYDALPDVIEVAYYKDKVELSRLAPKPPKKKREYQPPRGVRLKIGQTLISSGKEPRAFQVVELVDGNAIVREINVRDGEPVPNDWKFNDYLITPQKRTADGRPLKLYKK